MNRLGFARRKQRLEPRHDRLHRAIAGIHPSHLNVSAEEVVPTATNPPVPSTRSAQEQGKHERQHDVPALSDAASTGSAKIELV
jgi:hypothetical protein